MNLIPYQPPPSRLPRNTPLLISRLDCSKKSPKSRNSAPAMKSPLKFPNLQKSTKSPPKYSHGTRNLSPASSRTRNSSRLVSSRRGLKYKFKVNINSCTLLFSSIYSMLRYSNYTNNKSITKFSRVNEVFNILQCPGVYHYLRSS